MWEEAVKSAVLGLVVGDALGVPVEFMSRTELDADPVTGMRACGTHHQPAGTWSDDSSILAYVHSRFSGTSSSFNSIWACLI